MEIKFIGQGYNSISSSSVAKELISAFEDSDFTRFDCLVAFGSKAGVSGLTPHIVAAKSHLTEFNVIVGVDQKGTSKEALEELLAWDVAASVYHTTSRIIFHPKVYVFRGSTKSLVIVGSNNLTRTGLAQNIESSILVSFDNDNEIGQNFLAEIDDYFSNLLNRSDTNIQPISEDLINRLNLAGLVPSDEERKRIYGEEAEIAQSRNSNSDLSGLFGSIAIQQLPERFTSSRRTSGSSSYDTGQGGGQIEDSVQESANEELQPSRSNGVVIQANSGGISSVNLADTNSVLIAEISGGDRWKQANFDLETFEGFFGATAGDNSYFIKLRHVDSSGTITDEVLSQAVSVKSSNYRFELAAAAGIPFPSNGYPLGIFIKVGPDRFLYNLCLPDETFYQEVRNFLDSRWTGSNNRRMRIITNVATLKVNCPNLPLWINED